MKTGIMFSLLTIAIVAAAVAGEDAGTALKLELPRPMFVGTPKNVRSPNLEAPRKTKERPSFYVPAGSKNVASGKMVTSSDMFPIIGDLELVTDGDKEGADGSYVELGPGKQYVQIDLEAAFNIHAVVVWHFHSDPRVYRDVVVQIGADEDLIDGVQTVYNNDHDSSSGFGMGTDKEFIDTYEGRIIDAKGAKGRYVRLYSNGSTAGEMNHYIEVEVYATPAE